MNTQLVNMVYVIDTHILMWYFTGNRRLSEEVKDTIDLVRQQGGALLVPTIVLAEALNIASKGRVVFDFNHLYQLIRSEPGFEIVEFGVEIFEEVLRIHAIPEIHDRIIAATARFYGASLLTRDGVIRTSSEVKLD